VECLQLTHNLGVDVGGTFTDVIVFDEESGDLTTTKVLSTPENQSDGVVTGVKRATAKAGTVVGDLDLVFHGTTVVTNMLLEETGADVGLLVTGGHEHVLHLARAWTPGPLYGWMAMEKPEPLADLVDTRGISGRVASPSGEVTEGIDEGEVRAAVDDLVDNGVGAITVALLNSYLNPDLERQVRDVVSAAHPDVPVSISAEIVPEYGEYERTLTTVINDYARPTVIRYLDTLDEALAAEAFDGKMNLVRSDGGLMSSASAKQRPVELALSGPSGGVVGAATLAGKKDIPDVLTLDMGGTSTDVSLVEGGSPSTSRETKVGYREFKSRSVDINTVGAGGGSIARVQINGSLVVGPNSAGADPGPACYGQGGEDPTVTDANVVLGRIPAAVKLGGDLELDRDAARQAMESIADERGSSVEAAAQAVVDLVNENMYGALRVVSVERGYDPREFGLVAFGGAGPMHANALADLIGSYPLIVPPGPGVMSAFDRRLRRRRRRRVRDAPRGGERVAPVGGRPGRETRVRLLRRLPLLPPGHPDVHPRGTRRPHRRARPRRDQDGLRDPPRPAVRLLARRPARDRQPAGHRPGRGGGRRTHRRGARRRGPLGGAGRHRVRLLRGDVPRHARLRPRRTATRSPPRGAGGRHRGRRHSGRPAGPRGRGRSVRLHRDHPR
jgi:N-methylhydantoinase A